MSDSSDDSFVWTHASSSSDDNVMLAEKLTNREDKSVFESSHKKQKGVSKKRKQGEMQVKQELLNQGAVKQEPDSEAEAASPRKRARRETYYDSDDNPTTKENKIKNELINGHESVKSEEQQESDTTEYKKKKKKIKRNTNSPQEYDSMDFKVVDDFTAEETIIQTRTPNRRQSVSENGISAVKRKKAKKNKASKEISFNSDSVSEEIHSPQSQSPNRKQSVSENGMNVVKLKKEKKHKRSKEVSVNSGNVSEEFDSFDSKKNKRNLASKNIDSTNINSTEELNEHSVENGKKSSKKSHRSSKISDLIQFEEETDVSVPSFGIVKSTSRSSSLLLKQYVAANPHLHPLSYQSVENPLISQDDDIWLVHCPHEVSIMSLRDTDITLDSKSKIKVDDATYISKLENEGSKITILVLEDNKPVIKSFCLQGSLNFHKRIPRAHILEENTIVNNQTDFIPLPETKCRHPLFGAEYKKAMKIPSSVKARLNDSFTGTISPSKERKKKKKHKKEADDTSAVETEQEERKRKRSPRPSLAEDEQPVRNKRRRVKQEPAETWDSEQAIAESLFSY